MFTQLITWGEQMLQALLHFFSYFQLTIVGVFRLLGWKWLGDTIDWIINVLEKLPDVLTVFGDELLKFSFQTPLFELIVLSIPAYLAYQLIVWVLNIIT